MQAETPRPLPDTQEFRDKRRDYVAGFTLRHRQEMRKLVEGGVLNNVALRIDAKGLGWRNVGEHNIVGGIVAKKIGELVGLPEDEQSELVSVAATHDWDKRRQKERNRVAERRASDGTTIIEADVKKETADEEGKTGLVRVTGSDLRDFQTWGLKEKALRYVDSGLDQTSDGHADFVNWPQRMENLGKRNPKANKEEGKIYSKDGEEVLFYDDVLGPLTGQIQTELHNIILDRNPRFREEYPEPEMLTQLIRDQIVQDIESIPSKPPKAA